MAKVKLQNSVWNILFEGLKLYFKNIGTFSKYMLFPVFGQIIGIVLIFSLTGWFTFNLPSIVAKHPAFNDHTIDYNPRVCSVSKSFLGLFGSIWCIKFYGSGCFINRKIV